MEATLLWRAGTRFEVEPESGFSISFDSIEGDAAPSPMQALLCSVAACTAMDVISILEKKRQKVSAYRVEISGERPPKGEWPRPFTKVTVKHIIAGEDIDPAAVARAVQLSDEKYCSVSATLRQSPVIENTWEIN